MRIGSTPADAYQPDPAGGGSRPGGGFGGPEGDVDAPVHDVAGGHVAVAFAGRPGDPDGYLVRVFESDDVRYGGATAWYALLAAASVGLLLIGAAAGEVVSKRDLLSEVWQLAWGGSDRTVDVHLSWLRRKLGESAAHPRYLQSVRGVGVRLVAPPGPSGAG